MKRNASFSHSFIFLQKKKWEKKENADQKSLRFAGAPPAVESSGQARCRVAPVEQGTLNRQTRWEYIGPRFPRVALASEVSRRTLPARRVGECHSGSAKIPHQCAHWIRDDRDMPPSCHFESSAHAGEKSLLYTENHSLGEWFKRSLVAIMMTKKLPLRRIEVRSANCTTKQREVIQ